ncbi:2-hydroxyacid dehydrogenase [Actibacterium lipolyticum]|uniref:Glycerate dehydrogenase n=1 Tax=Actibacterium lipolyticum TaxID=1524263 RepID=A0A238JNJ3_9RHOB|nr:D-glycerate dehydrogenase [Actibacterium lipolyticum]SMX31757.1 Glycerate dehydrogenase [Actibacterium lipolyticum]
MQKLFITRPLPETVCDAARELADVTVRQDTLPLTEPEMIAALTDYDIVLPTLRDMFSADVLNKVEEPRAKLLANFGVGYNHIDADAARAKGITVTNTPGAVTDATADIALTLILMTCRRAAEGERLVRSGKWEGWHPTQMLGQHVTGKTLGVVGMGRIGKAIAKRCHFGFDMDVVFFNRSTVSDVGVPATQLSTIGEVAKAADMVVMAVPGSPATHHLFSTDEFNAMKPTAHFVNIARGDVVEEAALIAALQSGRIAGAGLDVYEFEPDVPEALQALPNVTLLPHLGTAALEVREAMGMRAVDNVRAFLSGKTPADVV